MDAPKFQTLAVLDYVIVWEITHKFVKKNIRHQKCGVLDRPQTNSL